MATDEHEMTDARSAREVLVWGRDVIDPALRAAVDRLPCSLRRIAGYHLGWWDERGRPARGGGGKAIRPTLTLLAAEAVGGVPAVAVPAAVAVELAHNFSLLHDDVMDGDTTRRHHPTAWTVFGLNAAVLGGDALLALALDVLASSGNPAAERGMSMLSTAVLEMVHGQSEDVAFEARADVDLAECLDMAERKTGALLGCACALGASFGGGSEEQVQHLRSFGEQIGLAFQLVDDLLGIWGDPTVTGKPAYSDLHNRKKSLPVVAALTCSAPAGRELCSLYRRSQPLSEDDVVHAAELIDAAGGRTWSQAHVDDLMEQALRHLQSARPKAQAAAELSALTRLITHRDH
jgi:geranylgeranyl diphosphate synthase, type I